MRKCCVEDACKERRTTPTEGTAESDAQRVCESEDIWYTAVMVDERVQQEWRGDSVWWMWLIGKNMDTMWMKAVAGVSHQPHSHKRVCVKQCLGTNKGVIQAVHFCFLW